MILTNNLALHPIVLSACEKAIQRPTPGAIRVTELLNPPIIKNLMLRHWDEIAQDVSELAWSVFGTSVHSMFEKLHQPGIIQGLGMEAKISGGLLRGTLDLLDLTTREVLDFKTTAVRKWVYKDFDHFIQQLNIYRWLLSTYGIKIDKLTNILIMKDWKSRDAKDSTGNYPLSPMMSFNAPVWPLEKTQAFIEERFGIYKTQPMTPCTAEERWEKTTYAVMVQGKKRAITNGVKNTLAEAQQMQRTCGIKNTYIDKRGGYPRRCLEYCPVKNFCPYGKNIQAGGNYD